MEALRGGVMNEKGGNVQPWDRRITSRMGDNRSARLAGNCTDLKSINTSKDNPIPKLRKKKKVRQK